MLKLPGLIDPHVHFRDPGQTEKEDFLTGTTAALAGGYTTVIDMPNNAVPITTRNRLHEKQKIAQEKIVCDVGFHFGSLGDNYEEFEKVKGKVLGLKLYLNQTTGNFLLDPSHLKKISRAWPQQLPILFHAENETFESVLEVLKETSRRIHLCHVSTKYELERVIMAKEKGLPVTCGVTPHHLFLTRDDEKQLGPYGKMRPPLQSRKDVDFLWKHLHVIDLIESDHAPHTKEEKESENPPNGIPGLETTLPLLLTAVSEGRLTLDDVIRLCHTGPARIFNIPNTPNLPNHPNTFIEVDKNAAYEIKNENLFTKCKWTPFAGWKVRGRVVRVTIRGKKVYEDGKILATPGSGTIIP